MSRGYVDGVMNETLEAWAARWWANVDAHWTNLRALVERWHPSGPSRAGLAHGMEITARNAEGARLAVLAEQEAHHEAERLTGDLLARFDAARAAKDHENLGAILNEAWMGVPESRSCWAIPGFGILCDLCADPPPDEAPVAGGDA